MCSVTLKHCRTLISPCLSSLRKIHVQEKENRYELDNIQESSEKQMNTEIKQRFQVSPELCKIELF